MRRRGDNGLLAYLAGLEQEHVDVLTRSASDDVIEAMNTFVQRMIGKALSPQHVIRGISGIHDGIIPPPCVQPEGAGGT